MGCRGRPRRAPPLGKLFRHGVLVKTHPRLLWEGKYLTGPPRRGSRPWRQRGHQDCMAADVAEEIKGLQEGPQSADQPPESRAARAQSGLPTTCGGESCYDLA